MIKHFTFRKALTWFIAGLVVTVFLISIISFYRKLKQPVETAFHSIPADVLFFLEIQKPGEFWSKQIISNKVWDNLRAFESPALFISDLSYIRNKALADSRVKDYFEKQRTYISFHPSAANDISALFTMELPSVSSGKDLIRFVTHLRSKSPPPADYEYEGADVYRIALNDQRKFVYVAAESGLFLCSFNKTILESSLKQLRHGNPLTADPSFNKVNLTAGKKVGAVLYVNSGKLGAFISSKLNPAIKDKIMPFRFLSQWTALDINLKPDKVIFTGFAVASDSSATFLSAIKKQKALLPGISAYVPASSVFIMNIGLADFNGFYKRLNEFYKTHKISNHLSDNIEYYRKVYGLNPVQEVLKHIVNDISFALFTGDDRGNRLFSLIHVDDVNAVSGSLEEVSSITGYRSSEKYKEYVIKRVILPCFMPVLLNKASNQADTLYYTAVNDYIIFTYSPGTVKKYLDSYTSGQMMSSNKKFLSLSENLFENSNIFIYSDFRECVSYLRGIWDDKISGYISSNLNRFGCIDEIALQYIYDNDDMNLTNMVITSNNTFNLPSLPVKQFTPESEPEPETAPIVQADKNSIVVTLDAPVTSGPFLVKEAGGNSGKMVVFDKLNNIYMIDENAKIIWKEQLTEQPLSKVWQVDYFKNGKLQLLFNTTGYIHIIDIKGNRLPGYPVKLKKKATNGIAVFDYDNNRKYRMLIAFDDNKVYNLDINCRPVADWIKLSKPAGVSRNIQFFRIAGKDIIAVTDNNGIPTFVNRKGDPVLTSLKALTISVNSSLFCMDNQLITSDKGGNVVTIDKTGKTKSESIGSYSLSHYFLSGQLGPGNKQVYVIIDKNILSIFGNDKKLLFKETLDCEITEKPVLIKTASGSNILAVYLRKSSKINFYTSSGKWDKAKNISGTTLPVIFPLQGRSKIKIAAGLGNKIAVYTF